MRNRTTKRNISVQLVVSLGTAWVHSHHPPPPTKFRTKTRSPSALSQGSPTKLDVLEKVGALIPASLLEDLGRE